MTDAAQTAELRPCCSPSCPRSRPFRSRAWRADQYRPEGVFAGDNLISFSKALGFLSDAPFMAAFQRAQPDHMERSLLWRLHTLCWAARRATGLEGDFVEAACYKGFSVRVICDAVGFGLLPKQYWAYDLFDAPGQGYQRLPAHGSGLYEAVQARFSDLANVRLIQGRLPDSLSQGAPERIAFLHLDMNDPAAESETLRRLFDRIVPGGVIVLDDWGWAAYGDQRAIEEPFFAAHGLHVLELPTGQGLVIR